MRIYYPNLNGSVGVMPKFKKGDPPPTGYLEWHEWARVQHKGGLRQKRCPRYKRWQFPQEMKTHECKEPAK